MRPRLPDYANAPRTRRLPGRPKEGRIPSTGEIAGGSKKKVEPNKCSRCLKSGHNRRSCTNPI
ncbi:unnamed protein product [Thlaspi arvense]|uniref:CCHC-type domain-containing protein n=1 Tax=Thlaspi arvense TaxID=13288 RepID=A0AAU9SKK5_THLAR|nr:unnamed protein product [Thlaspi arvense]